MRGDIPQAAFNLLTKLPVRTHEWSQEVERVYEGYQYKGGSKGQKVEYLGVVYKSHRALVAAVPGLSHAKVRALLGSGQAKDVE